MTVKMERTMTQEEAQELVDGINALLRYRPSSQNIARWSYRLHNNGWNTEEVECEEAEAGYQIVLDPETMIEDCAATFPSSSGRG